MHLSRLMPPFERLKLKYVRWIHILLWPFGFTFHQLEAFATEARKDGQALSSYAKANARKEWEDMIDEY